MQYSICFSLIARGQSEILTQSIVNILTYNPNSMIVVILSDFEWGMTNQIMLDKEYIYQLYSNKVVFNKIKIDTHFGEDLRNNLTIGHLYNYLHVIKNYEFQYFIPIDTSVMFIKTGLHDYIKNFDYANGKQTFKSSDLAFLPNFIDLNLGLYGWEPYQGCFFKNKVLLDIYGLVEILNEVPPIDQNIFFNSITPNGNKGNKFVCMFDAFDFKSSFIKLDEDFIKSIENNNLSFKNKITFNRWSNVDINDFDFNNIYAIGPIKNNVNDPGRKYIWNQTSVSLQNKLDFVF